MLKYVGYELKYVLLDVCFCVFLGQSVTEGAELEADGGFHVQRAEETRLRGWIPLAFPIY